MEKDLLADIKSFFQSAQLLDGFGVGLDQMPESPDDCIGIYEYAGDPGQQQVAGALRSIQVVARSKSAARAKTKIKELYGAFNVEDGILNLTEERWCALFLRDTPFKIRVDNQQRQYYGFNVGMNTYID